MMIGLQAPPMLLDANVLLYSVDQSLRHHALCADWIRDAFTGPRRIALPWQTIGAFLRIATHPRVFSRPLSSDDAWTIVERWLMAPNCWIPEASERTARILGKLINELDIRGNLITDAQLAALAIEHGVPVVSVDSDFARFSEVQWVNPLIR
jgi:toxin-antitoxin system PIN domain toxin